MKSSIDTSDFADFLGIFEGKAKARKEEAEAAAKVAIEKAQQDTLLLKLEAARQGYTPDADAAKAIIETETVKLSGEKTLYYVLGGVVVAVMAGLYFIRKK